MRSFLVLALLAAALLITGCGDLLTLHSLYTDKDDLLDASFEGTWETKDQRLTVTRADSGYRVTLADKEDPSDAGKFEAHLVDVAGVRFADIIGPDAVGHMLIKVQVVGSQLRMAFWDSEWLRQRITYEEADIANGRKQPILTVHTKDLRALVAKYAGEPKAYDNEVKFERAK